MKPLHVLLTNDDGVSCEGLQVLRRELIGCGIRVTVVAPAENQSGMARSVTCRRPVTVNEVEADSENAVYACHGTPVDCVRVAMLSDLVDDVDAVVSGINHGVNLGDDATLSGTLGAALEGAMLGVPAVAFSQQDDDGDFTLVSHGGHTFALAPFAAKLARLIAGRSQGFRRVALNVNLPHDLATTTVRLTRLANFDYPAGWTPAEAVGSGKWSVWSYANPSCPNPGMEDATDTDVVALADGAISISPVLAEWSAGRSEDHDGDLLGSLAALSRGILQGTLAGASSAHAGAQRDRGSASQDDEH